MSGTIIDLPFVVDCADGVRRFWCVEPSGDYGADCNTGSRYALDYLRHLAGTGIASLQWIVSAMPRGKLTGIEVGFLSIVAHAAAAGLGDAEQRVPRQEAIEAREICRLARRSFKWPAAHRRSSHTP